MYSDIKTAITNNITAITDLKYVYGYEKGELEGYPSATIVCKAIESNIDSTDTNDRKYTFKISIYQEMLDDGVGAVEAESRIEGMLDTLISTFEKDYTLGGLCYTVNIKSVLAYIQRGNSLRVFEITLECMALANIN